MSARAAGIRRLNWDPLPGSLCGFGQASILCWQVVRGFCFYASLSIRVLLPWWLTSPGMNVPRKNGCCQDGSHGVFYNVILEVIYHDFFHILLITQDHPGIMWEGDTKGCEYQEIWIIGSHLEAGYKWPEQCLAHNRYSFVSSGYYSPNVHRLGQDLNMKR